MGILYHLQVGCADASVIKTQSHTFLVDCHGIDRYRQLLPYNRVLKGVFITHQHRDHFSGLQYLRDNGYSIQFLIYSPYERRRIDASVGLEEWNEFQDHIACFVARGTKTYTPFRPDTFDTPFWDIDNVCFQIIGPHERIAKADTRELHDACLVIKAEGAVNCLFAGDASDTALAEIASTTINFCNGILHASHHGSINGAEPTFVRGCNAVNTVVSTATGFHEGIPHPDAMRLYRTHTRKRVYRTDTDGSVRWDF